MPLNIPGLLVPFHLLVNPRLVIPHISVKDIRQIDFHALKRAGYRGAVFDKDNCITLPHRDTLIPELQDSWRECREVFGDGNVLIVSNSAGTTSDAGGIQAESVSYHLQVPVLRHASLKPSYACIKGIRSYFASLLELTSTDRSGTSHQEPKDTLPALRDSELVIVGDRIFTDVVLANRIRSSSLRASRKTASASKAPAQDPGPGTLAIWTTGVWQQDSTLMRWAEKALVQTVEKWSTPPSLQADMSRFVKRPHTEQPIVKTKGPGAGGIGGWIWDRMRFKRA